MLGRQGQSMLANMGLHNWISHSEADYVQQAVAWGQSGTDVCDKLQGLRRSLRAQAAQSPLFDASRFARDWWSALQGLWREKMA
jgi:predicted O-linked N-acetylglucosamine transferase (SPINDLY family)